MALTAAHQTRQISINNVDSLLIFYRHLEAEREKRLQQSEILSAVIGQTGPKDLVIADVNQEDSEALAERRKDLLGRIQDMAKALGYNAYADENEARGLLLFISMYGPIAGLIADPTLTEIMVNGKSKVFVEQDGSIALTSLTFDSSADILAVMHNILSPLGRSIDMQNPIADARLPDGSRVNCTIPPASVEGPMLTIRKFNADIMHVKDLIENGTLSDPMAQFLRFGVYAKRNIVISGGASSGKTTLLNVLSSFVPQRERIITIEEAAELKLPHNHLGRLESRPADALGKGAITIRELFRNSLRMRPDRIIVGETRGDEILDMLQALNSGHSGSMTTIHANSPRESLSRMEMLMSMASDSMTTNVARQLIAASIGLIIQTQRYSDGTRKVASIVEVTGMEGQVVSLSPLFEFRQRGIAKDGTIVGEHISRGFRPRFFEEAVRMGLKPPEGLF